MFNNKRKKGFSLTEAMIATVILGIAAVGVLLPFTTGASVQAEGMHRTLAARLASDLMENVVRTPFDQIVETFNRTEQQGHIKDSKDEVYTDSNYDNFSRNVTCSYVNVSQESGAGIPKFILATIRVYYQDREIIVLNRLITK